MTEMPPNQRTRRPRVLWANAACLLDTSSGASMTIREVLKQLSSSMMDVRILGATNFDNDSGTNLLKSYPHALKAKPQQILTVNDGPLVHNLFVTSNISRPMMTAGEELAWFVHFVRLLTEFRPDLLLFYGGFPLELTTASDARVRGIPSACYIANGSYNSTRWCRDVDVVLTDSEATAKLYLERIGIEMKPIGKFIDQSKFVSKTHSRKNLLFINPSPEKGAGIVLRLAGMLRKIRPDIQIEVVESRGKWADAISQFRPILGMEIMDLSNVTVTPHLTDMRPAYGRARLLIAPSLWWESSGRVLAEAMLNAIPCIVTNRGGMPEMIRDAGKAVELPEKYFEKPHLAVPDAKELEPFMQFIIEMYDNEEKYQALVEKARLVAAEQHHISVSTRKLIAAISPLLALRAGDGDFEGLEKIYHKHGKSTLIGPAARAKSGK